ncbi:MAG: phytanoyl-CoA dioxygenase family protein [Novosphingobium sp.]|nr:phytanoyl-CoA dioxygenase family protein [Novosphingobium sp.]
MTTTSAGLEVPTPTNDVSQGLEDLARFGFAIHRGLVSPEEAARLRDRVLEQGALERERDLVRQSYNTMQTVTFLPNKGRCFIDLIMNPTVRAYAKGVLGHNLYKVFAQDAVILEPGKEGVSMMHIDQSLLGFPTPRPLIMNMMLALENFDRETGSTRLVPASHLGPVPDMDPASPDQTREAVSFDLEPGTALIWERRTWHRTGENVSDRTRCSIATLFCDPVINQKTVLIAGLHDRVFETLNDEEKAVLGFRDVYGTNMICPRNPEDTRQHVNRTEPYVPELHR